MRNEDKKAWWQMTQTPKQGFALAGLNVVLALLSWVIVLIEDDLHPIQVVVAVLFSLIAVALGASSLALRSSRRQGM